LFVQANHFFDWKLCTRCRSHSIGIVYVVQNDLANYFRRLAYSSSLVYILAYSILSEINWIDGNLEDLSSFQSWGRRSTLLLFFLTRIQFSRTKFSLSITFNLQATINFFLACCPLFAVKYILVQLTVSSSWHRRAYFLQHFDLIYQYLSGLSSTFGTQKCHKFKTIICLSF
jgi:hypothetical protein